LSDDSQILAKTWYCVIRSGDYRLLYIGTEKSLADTASNERTYCGRAETFGQAQRDAAMGAGRLTQLLGNAGGDGRF